MAAVPPVLKPDFKAPPYYDGTNPDQWRLFENSITNALIVYADSLDTDAKKIIYIMSFLGNKDGTECPAANWSEDWKRTHWDAAAGTFTAAATFAAFWTNLKATFEDKLTKEAAFKQLNEIKQGKTPFHEFLKKFELLASRAGVNTDNFVMISCLKKAANSELIHDAARTVAALPTVYADFKAWLIQLDDNLRAIAGTSSHSHTTHNTRDPKQAYTAPAHSAGIPMDIGATRICFMCGQPNADHMARNCPNPCYKCHKKHPGQRHTREGGLIALKPSRFAATAHKPKMTLRELIMETDIAEVSKEDQDLLHEWLDFQ
jgi:hypothetical protein